MNYAQIEFGNLKIYVPADATSAGLQGTRINTTATGEKITKIKAEFEEMVIAVATSLQEKLAQLPTSRTPSEIEISFSVGFSGELKAWVFGGKAEHGINLKLVWSRA